MQAISYDYIADIRPPKLRHSVMELGRVFLEMGASVALGPLFKTLPEGDGHSIMTLPGFMGADGSTAQLRKFLNNRGYKAVSWGLGRNTSEHESEGLERFLDDRIHTEQLVAEEIRKEYEASGRKVTLIGWSLGGLYAVSLAHQYPEMIRQVITLGTPYGDPRGTALYNVMEKLYDNAEPVDEASLRRWTEYTYSGGLLQVPVLALYSESDGIVSPGIAKCQGDPKYVTNMAVMASHVGFPFNPLVYAVIANSLVKRDRRWAICRSSRLKPLFHVN